MGRPHHWNRPSGQSRSPRLRSSPSSETASVNWTASMPAFARRGNVADSVVDVEDAFDRMAQPTTEDFEDLPVGLGHAFRPRYDDVVEQAEDLREDLRRVVERLGRPVRQGDHSHATRPQVAQDRRGPGNQPAQRQREVGSVPGNLLGEVWMAGRRHRLGIRPRPARVLSVVPRCEVELAAVHEALGALQADDCRHSRDRVPDHDHSAQIEHHRGHASNPPTGQDCLGTCLAHDERPTPRKPGHPNGHARLRRHDRPRTLATARPIAACGRAPVGVGL